MAICILIIKTDTLDNTKVLTKNIFDKAISITNKI